MNRTVMVLAACGALALGMVVSSWFLSRFMVKVRHETRISAKGYAEKTVTSDLGSFEFTVTVKAPVLADGYRQLQAQMRTVLTLVREFGFTAAELEIGGIRYEEVYKLLANGNAGNELLHYQIFQSVRVRSKKVQTIADNYRKLNALLADGTHIAVAEPEYFIADPESYKLELTTVATRSATARAKAMADECGATLRELLAARLGVIQITRPASSALSDYGTYDTGSVEKVIKIVVAVEYSIR